MQESIQIGDLGKTARVSKLCHDSKRPITVKKDGRADLVIMSVELYEEMIATQDADKAITESEAEYSATGELYDAGETFSSLRRKYFE